MFDKCYYTVVVVKADILNNIAFQNFNSIQNFNFHPIYSLQQNVQNKKEGHHNDENRKTPTLSLIDCIEMYLTRFCFQKVYIDKMPELVWVQNILLEDLVHIFSN